MDELNKRLDRIEHLLSELLTMKELAYVMLMINRKKGHTTTPEEVEEFCKNYSVNLDGAIINYAVHEYQSSNRDTHEASQEKR